MDRRAFITVVGGSVLAPLAAAGAGKIHRIGVLSQGRPSTPSPVFLKPFFELGWTPGKDLLFEGRFADGNLDRLPALAAELVQLKVSLVLALGTLEALAAKRATATIPIVF